MHNILKKMCEDKRIEIEIEFIFLMMKYLEFQVMEIVDFQLLLLVLLLV